MSREPASWRVGAGDSDDTSPLAPKIDLLLLQLAARKTKTKTKKNTKKRTKKKTNTKASSHRQRHKDKDTTSLPE